MIKIILLEDREPRQALFLKSSKIELSALKNNIEMKTGEESNKIFDKINKHKIETSKIFKNYDVVIVHKSALTNYKIYNNLIEYFIQNISKTLVLFSGGISESIFTTQPFSCLQINSKILYSKNLLEYSHNTDLDINYLAYGKRWKLNYMIRLENLYQLKKYDELKIQQDEISNLESLCDSNINNIVQNIKIELEI